MSDKPAPSSLGDRVCVLVVEDEMMIALDVQMMLEDNGYAVLGPAGAVEGALRLLDDTRPDVAVLDGNLRGRPVVPVAQRLRDLGIPFVLSSAYDIFPFDGSEALAGIENVRKPATESRLIAALQRAYDKERRGMHRKERRAGIISRTGVGRSCVAGQAGFRRRASGSKIRHGRSALSRPDIGMQPLSAQQGVSVFSIPVRPPQAPTVSIAAITASGLVWCTM